MNKCTLSSGKVAYQSAPCSKDSKPSELKAPKAAANAPKTLEIEEAKELIKAKLANKPELARFQSWRRVRHEDGAAICVEINELDLDGNYIGFRRVGVKDNEVIWYSPRWNQRVPRELSLGTGLGSIPEDTKHRDGRARSQYLRFCYPSKF